MGSSASTSSAATAATANSFNALSHLQIDSEVDAFDGKLWWRSQVTQVQHKKKPHYIRVICENGCELKVLFGTTKHNKTVDRKIAALGTHTRETLTDSKAAAENEQFSNSDETKTTTHGSQKNSNEDNENDDDENENGDDDDDDDDVPQFSRNQQDDDDELIVEVGERYDILDIYTSAQTGGPTKRWRKATVIKTKGDKALINFEGWKDEYNIWLHVEKDAERFATLGEHTEVDESDRFVNSITKKSKKSNKSNKKSKSKNNKSKIKNKSKSKNSDHQTRTGETQYHLVKADFQIGSECYGKDEYISKKTMELAFTWRHATVIKMEDDSIYLHFTKWSSKWDAWYDLNEGKIMSVTEYERTVQTEKKTMDEEDGSELAYNNDNDNDDESSSSSTIKTMEVVPIRTVMPRTRGDGLVGLENLGNTCFMNSCLQCLLNTTPLAAYFLEQRHMNEKNPKSSSSGRFVSAFSEFIQDYWSTQNGIAKAPRQLKKVIGKFARQFSGFSQHDAQEVR